MAASCTYEFQWKHFGFIDVKAEDFYVSQWWPSKIGFVLYRAIIFLYWTGWMIYAAIEYSWHEPGYPYYLFLSHWAEWTLVLHFGFALAVAVYGLGTSEKRKETPSGCRECCSPNNSNTGGIRWFLRLSWIFQTVVVAICYLVTIVFWAFLRRSRSTPQVNIHRHALNSVLVTVDLFISRVPVRFLHFVYISLYGITYLIFTLILHITGVRSSFYDSILNWERIPVISAGVCIGVICIAAPLLHGVAFGFYHLRAYVARRCGCHNGVTFTDDDAQGLNGALKEVMFRKETVDEQV